MSKRPPAKKKIPSSKTAPVIAVFSSDTHIQELAWANYPRLAWDAILGFHQLVNLANHYQVPLLLAGDIMDKRANGPDVVRRFTQALHRLQTPLYFIRGDHDGPPPGWPIALGNAAELGQRVVELHACPDPASRRPPVCELAGGIRVGGVPWMPEPELLQHFEHVKDCHVVLLHQSLVEIADFEAILSIRDLPEGPQMFIVGHIHRPIALANERGQRIVSPGGTNAQSIAESDEKYAYLLRRDLRVTRVPLHTRKIMRVHLVATGQDDSALDAAVQACREILDGAKDSARAEYLDLLPGQTQESIVRPIVQVTYQVTIPGAAEKITNRLRGLCHLFTKPVDVGTGGQSIGRVRTAGVLGEPLRAVYHELELSVPRESKPQLHSDCLALLDSPDAPKEVLMGLRRSAGLSEEIQ